MDRQGRHERGCTGIGYGGGKTRLEIVLRWPVGLVGREAKITAGDEIDKVMIRRLGHGAGSTELVRGRLSHEGKRGNRLLLPPGEPYRHSLTLRQSPRRDGLAEAGGSDSACFDDKLQKLQGVGKALSCSMN